MTSKNSSFLPFLCYQKKIEPVSYVFRFGIEHIEQMLVEQVLSGDLPGPFVIRKYSGIVDPDKLTSLLQKLDVRQLAEQVTSDNQPWLMFSSNSFVISYNYDTKNKYYIELCSAGGATEFSSLHEQISTLVDISVRPTIYSLEFDYSAKLVKHPLGDFDEDLERDNYSSETLNALDHMISDLQAKEPCGRLSILDGEPGTGKTFILRSLPTVLPELIIVVVPVEEVKKLLEPSRALALRDLGMDNNNNQRKRLLLLIEDADALLTEREEGGNASAVSTLLNLCDGIVGNKLDLSVICTTNLQRSNIDRGIARDGRLCSYINVEKLTSTHAQSVYRRLTGKDLLFPNGSTLASVYKAARLSKSSGMPQKIQKVTGFGI